MTEILKNKDNKSYRSRADYEQKAGEEGLSGERLEFSLHFPAFFVSLKNRAEISVEDLQTQPVPLQLIQRPLKMGNERRALFEGESDRHFVRELESVESADIFEFVALQHAHAAEEILENDEIVVVGLSFQELPYALISRHQSWRMAVESFSERVEVSPRLRLGNNLHNG